MSEAHGSAESLRANAMPSVYLPDAKRVLWALGEERGDAYVRLGPVMALAAGLGITTRIMSGLESKPQVRIVSLSTADADPLLALRIPGQKGARLLDEREQVAEDTWEYEVSTTEDRAVFWLELSRGERSSRVGFAATERALLDAHGWRDDLVLLTAEPVLLVADLRRAIAHLIDEPRVSR